MRLVEISVSTRPAYHALPSRNDDAATFVRAPGGYFSVRNLCSRVKAGSTPVV
ncbi:MAG: hypothetical protein H7343_04285 [Undibacterium sp.]|nr:hypothetical protein [Opitutaceae bacterium]